MKQDGGLLGRVLYHFADPAYVVSVQRGYVRFFREVGARRVLDLGSGRGLFLGLLREAGIEGVGVDASPEAVAACRRAGFAEVELGSALEFLAAKAETGERYPGIFCSHLIEHLPGEAALALLERAAAVLAARGRLVLVTPNCANPEVWTRVFWLDPTHVRPYPRPLLEALLEAMDLRVVASFDDPHTRRPYLGRDLLRLPADFLRYGLNFWAGMDSIVVGERQP